MLWLRDGSRGCVLYYASRCCTGPPGVLLGMTLPVCPYCGRGAAHRSSSNHIYGRDYGPVWECSPCGAWVGCHKGGKPLGTPANRTDRSLRKQAHAAFDPLWRRVIERRGVSQTQARSAGYKWLSRELGVPIEECHIGMMHGEDLRRVVLCCTPPYGLHPDTESAPISELNPST